MISLIRGSTAELSFEIEGLDISQVSKVEFFFKGIEGEVNKEYPKDITYVSPNFIIDLSSEDTFKFNGLVDIQAKVTYSNGEILQTDIVSFDMKASICEVDT